MIFFCILWVIESFILGYSGGKAGETQLPVGEKRDFSNRGGDFVSQSLKKRWLSMWQKEGQALGQGSKAWNWSVPTKGTLGRAYFPLGLLAWFHVFPPICNSCYLKLFSKVWTTLCHGYRRWSKTKQKPRMVLIHISLLRRAPVFLKLLEVMPTFPSEPRSNVISSKKLFWAGFLIISHCCLYISLLAHLAVDNGMD